MGVGAELAEARQSLALTLDELSARTKISVERLAAIEQMDVTQLPSLVYLKGFVRAYAAEVQLDPDDIAQRYLSEVDIPPDLSLVASDAATPVSAWERVPERADDWKSDFPSENAADVELPALEPLHRHSPQQEWDAQEINAPSRPSISRPSWTRCLPVAFVLLIAAAAGWVLSANFDRLTRRVSTPVAPEPLAPEPVAPAVSEGTPKSGEIPANAASSRNADASRGRAPASADAARKTEPTTIDDKKPGAADTAPTAGPDLSGSWSFTNRVESSSDEEFRNLNLGFRLQLQQRGNRVTGTGEKWMENGRSIPPGSRTPIAVDGTLTGRQLELTFTERGARRSSVGTFVMEVADDGTLRGTFATDAGKAQGTSLARRIAAARRD